MARGSSRLSGVYAILTVVLTSAGAAPATASAQQRSAAPPALVFDGVTVVDVEHGKLIPGQRLVIVGNRIQTMGAAGSVKTPEGAQVVDARGKYMIPGLWDLHTHSMRLATDVFYPLFVANGVTGIRDAWSPVPLDTLRQWRREILAGTRVGPPRQILSGPMIQTYCPVDEGCVPLDPDVDSVHLAANARHLVDSLKSAGADMIKMRDLFPATTYLVIAGQARRVGIPFGGHAWDSIDVAASDSGASIIDHARPWYDVMTGLRGHCWRGRGPASVELCRPMAERFRRNNTWALPSLIVEQNVGQGVAQTERARAVYGRSSAYAEQFWHGALAQGNWLRDSTHPTAATTAAASGAAADSLGALRIMERVGFPIVAGTDAAQDFLQTMPPGFALHTELAMDVAEGLTPLTALQSATINPARMWHATDSLGTVAPGKLADLVLLDENPLVDITNTTTIRAVVTNGRYFDRAALDRLLADARTAAQQSP